MTTTTNATTTTTATHYRLSIELTTHVSPDTRDGEPGEEVILADLVATDGETGERWIYTLEAAEEGIGSMMASGPIPSSGRVSREMSNHAIREFPEIQGYSPGISPGADGEPVVIEAPVTHAGEPAVAGDTFEVPVKPGTVTIGGRRRKVDAGKVRRLAGCAAG